MYVKTKKEKKERHWISFIIILTISLIATYFILDNNSLTIKSTFNFDNIIFFNLFDIKIYFIIITIIFNYGNIYQILLLFYSLIFPQFIYSIYCLLLNFTNHSLNNEQNLFYSYFVIFLFFLIIGQILFCNNKNGNNNMNNINYKGICLYILVLLFLLIALSFLKSNIISLDKIISSFLLSFSCYFFIFYVLNIDQNDPLQLFFFMEYININIIIVLFFVLIFISFYLSNNTNNKYPKLSPSLFYLNSIIIPIYGIKNEYKSLFKSNRKNWINFNFENKKKDKNNDNITGFISEITITKPIKWNETSFVISIFRLLFLIFIQFIIFYLSNNFNNVGDMGSIDEITINNSFLYFVSSISLFVVNKIILYWMKLLNMTYFFLERNSINSR